METTVYIGDVSPLLNPSIFEKMLDKVPAYRKEKILHIKHSSGQAQSLAAGLLLRRACLDFGIPGADEHVVLGENGKPNFAREHGGPQIHFNLSHSHDRAMCVVSPYEVGCDVEQIKNARPSLVKRYFSQWENQWMQQEGDFCRLWTLKESYMKVTGLGLGLSPSQFSLEIQPGGNIALHHEGVQADFLFREINLDDGYRYAYCLKNAPPETQVNIVKVELSQ